MQGCRVEGVLYAWVRVTRREPVLVGAAKPASSVSRSRRVNKNRTSEKAAQIGTIHQAERRWSLVNAGVPPGTLIYAEKVRCQFLSLRQPGRLQVFSERSPWQISPVYVAISNLSSELPTGGIGLFFSERPISLRTSGLHPFGTVLKIRSFRGT
jgi:hypothetical protein